MEVASCSISSHDLKPVSYTHLQTVKTAAELIPNSFVAFKTDATLALSAGTALTGGANGTVTNDSYQTFLDKLESYAVNVVGCCLLYTSRGYRKYHTGC